MPEAQGTHAALVPPPHTCLNVPGLVVHETVEQGVQMPEALRATAVVDQYPSGHAAHEVSAVVVHATVRLPAEQLEAEQAAQAPVSATMEFDQYPVSHATHEVSADLVHATVWKPAVQLEVEHEGQAASSVPKAEKVPVSQSTHTASVVSAHACRCWPEGHDVIVEHVHEGFGSVPPVQQPVPVQV